MGNPDQKYPWHKVGRGRGFFVPCLDVERVRVEGLKAAMLDRSRAPAYAEVVIFKGKLGVLFYRTYPGR